MRLNFDEIDIFSLMGAISQHQYLNFKTISDFFICFFAIAQFIY